MTRNTDDTILDGLPLEDSAEEGPNLEDENQLRREKVVLLRRPSSEGYGRPISTEPCSFCHGAGTVEKRRGKVMCLACDGIGTKGGAGKGRHPITLDMVRPYRTHMEEKPLED